MLMKKFSMLMMGAAVLSSTALFAQTKEEIAKLVAEDLTHEVYPGGVEGRAFWNGAARFFMYPPAFDFPTDAAAQSYRFEVVDAKGKMHVFEAERPSASLACLWPRLPTGWTSVMCISHTKTDNRLVYLGSRTFWKQAPFTGDYLPAACGYGEFSRRAKAWLFAQPAFQKFLKTKNPDCGYWGLIYPSKMVAAIVQALCSGEPTEQEVAAARVWMDWILTLAEKPGRPLAYFTPTYFKVGKMTNNIVDEFGRQTMLDYPSRIGLALLALHSRTKDARYFDHAKGIAETYLKLQGEDGTWGMKLWIETGKSVKENRLMPVDSVIPFLEKMYEVTKDTRYRAAADRAFGYVEAGPLKTWNWEAMFEDIDPDLPYRNLTKYGATYTAMYLVRRYPNDARRLAKARELLRFAEDQFVCWEKPFPDMPKGHNMQDVPSWRVPGALEQYYWYLPIDASASQMVMAYLALYAAEKNPLDLAKARALGDAITRQQKPDGDVPTHWVCWDKGCSWWNCLLFDVKALNELEAVTAK